MPLSAHTSWPLLPGTSPWVHHFAVHLWLLKETTEPPTYAVVAFHAGAVHLPGDGGGEDGPPLHAPWSAHTPWLLLPGVSPWVHHFAFQVCPLKDTVEPPTYAVVAFHAGAEHEPGGLGGPVVVGGPVGGATPANLVVNFVKSNACCGTLLHTPDVVPWLG